MVVVNQSEKGQPNNRVQASRLTARLTRDVSCFDDKERIMLMSGR